MDLFLREATERIGADDALSKIDALMDWPSFSPILERGLGRSGVGPQGYDPLVLFKCLLIGQWHGLSDPKLERALKVRLDFMIFCGLNLHARVPDETTHCRFRNALVRGGVYDDLLAEVCRQIEGHGLKLKEAEAAIIDATLVESAARPRTHIDAPEDRAEGEAPDDPQMHFSADPDARWVKKGSKSTLGYKAFARRAFHVRPIRGPPSVFFDDYPRSWSATTFFGKFGSPNAYNQKGQSRLEIAKLTLCAARAILSFPRADSLGALGHNSPHLLRHASDIPPSRVPQGFCRERLSALNEQCIAGLRARFAWG